MGIDYSLEALEKKFAEHDRRLQIENEKRKKQREKEGWDPPCYDEDFSLPQAFVTIIKEIRNLKERK